MAARKIPTGHEAAGRRWPRGVAEPSLSSAIVIFVATSRGAFAVEAQDGRCAVFCQSAGPPVLAGDVLEGEVLARGARLLRHADGWCAVVGDSGPVSRKQADELVNGRAG
jgi:hypothetical protein